MTADVHLDQRDAEYISELLFCLAKLVNPELGEHDGYRSVQLSEPQRQLLTNPPARSLTRHPDQMADRMLELVAKIQGQLGDDAAQL